MRSSVNPSLSLLGGPASLFLLPQHFLFGPFFVVCVLLSVFFFFFSFLLSLPWLFILTLILPFSTLHFLFCCLALVPGATLSCRRLFASHRIHRILRQCRIHASDSQSDPFVFCSHAITDQLPPLDNPLTLTELLRDGGRLADRKRRSSAHSHCWTVNIKE